MWSAALLARVGPKTVEQYVALRDAGRNPFEREHWPRAIDPFLNTVEEWVDDSLGKIRADVTDRKLVAMGFTGNERSTRSAVAEAAWKSVRRQTYRPWVPEPGLWLQMYWGKGPDIGGRKTWLFCVWLAWSRSRVVIPVWDCTIGTTSANLYQVFRTLGGVPTFVLSDNAKTVTVEARRRDPGAPSADGGFGTTLRLFHRVVRAVRSGVQGQHRSHCEDREVGPAAAIPLVRRTGRGLPGVLRPGEPTPS